MGLPLFITPPEPEVTAKAADKVAARARSIIRRARAVRRPGHRVRAYHTNGDAALLQTAFLEPPYVSVALHENRDSLGVQRLAESPERIGQDDEEALLARAARIHQRHLQARSPGYHGRPDLNERGFPMYERLRDDPALSHTPPPPDPAPHNLETTEPAGINLPPVPESADFQGNSAPDSAFREQRRAILHRQYELVRNGTRRPSRQARYPSLIDTATRSSITPQLPSLTPNFSPARPFMGDEALEASRTDANLSEPPAMSNHEWDQLNNAPSVLSELPPLRRMGRRGLAEFESRRRRLRAARLDGLGDRDRSLSPEGDGAWDTLLTTLTPDPQQPSAGSSFASTSAAASASSNPGSSGTSLTTMDDASFENACDIIEDCSDMSDTEGDEEVDIYELQDGAHEARDRFWRSYADVVAARADRVARHSGAGTDSLGGMQRIVRRLARREDIPDEWWAEAGLSRTFSRSTFL